MKGAVAISRPTLSSCADFTEQDFKDVTYKANPVRWAQEELGLALDDWQKAVLTSPHKRKVLNCSRQSGKSTVAAVKALHRAIHYPNSLILLISPSLRQSSELFRKVMDLYNSLPSRPKLVENNRTSLMLRSGSRIVSLPSTEATVRGYSKVDLVEEDESAAVPEELNEAVEPMLAVSNGEYVKLSTPRGRKGHFYKATLDPTYERYTVTADQVPRISKEFLDAYKASHGTRMFAQEFECTFLGDRLGALWKSESIDAARLTQYPSLVRVVVGVDPAVTGADDSDETGIVVAGIGENGHIYVLDDRSIRGSPNAWAVAAVSGYDAHKADRMVGEVNNGGDLVEKNIRTVSPRISYKGVHASRGKQIRAEPVSALYEQGKVHHVGFFDALEGQMTEWVPGEASPDRMDALVWAVTDLALGGGSMMLMGGFDAGF